MVEKIWVSVAEGAQRIGHHLDHVRRLARESWRLPEDQRPIHVRKDGHAYALWLPDLVNYVEKRIPATMQNIDLSAVEETWVNTTEGAKITGYSRGRIAILAMEMLEKPEDQREIRVKKRANGNELWLPDLIAYRYKVGRGPKKRRRSIS